MTEVRVLSSAGVTRPRRLYDPVRLPPGPSPQRCRSRDLRPDGSPPITRFTLPACRAQYPGGSNDCMRRLLRHLCRLPRFEGGSASASVLSRPAQASLTLQPAGSLNRPRRPLSRGFNPASHPAKPLVSYQGNRQFPGWNLPPLVKRAVGAHLKNALGRPPAKSLEGRVPVSEFGRQVSPGRAGTGDPEGGFDKATIVRAMPTGIAGFTWNEGSYLLPLLVAEKGSNHGSFPISSLESELFCDWNPGHSVECQQALAHLTLYVTLSHDFSRL